MADLDRESLAGQLNLAEIEAHLATRYVGRARGWKNELWDTINSTNDRAAELCRQGAPAGVLVLAREQTAGRGRQGHHWVSPGGAGLYLSIILRPQGSYETLPLYTLGCGVAAARAIACTAGIQVGLKWVNDIVYQGRKVGGILAEIPSVIGRTDRRPPFDSQDGSALVLGIGINLRFNSAEVPDDLKNRLDWLERIAGQPVDRNLLVAALSLQVEDLSDRLESNRSDEVVRDWRDYSVTLGREIRATTGDTTIEGTAVDITDTGGLEVRTNDNQLLVLYAGEISIRGIDGRYA